MKKRICILLMICSMICGAMGCGSKASEEPKKDTEQAEETSAPEGKKTLTLAYIDGSGEEKAEDGWIWQMAMNTYEKWDKKDEVELELVPYIGTESDYFTKMALDLSDKSTAPDIFYEDSFRITVDSAAGYLAPLDEFLPKWDTWADGSMIEACKEAAAGMDGSIYGIPLATDSRGIWANKSILEQAGLSADWKPATWEELLEGCRQIKERCPDVIPLWYTCEENSEGTSMNTFEMVLYGTPDHLFDEETGKWNIRSQAMLDSLNFFKTTVKEGLTGSVSEITNTPNALNYAGEYMRSKKLAMVLTSTAVPNAFFQPGASFEWEGWDEELTLIPMPTQKGDLGGSVTMSGGYTWSVSQSCEEKELAFEFITAMMDNKEEIVSYMLKCGQLPTVDVSEAANYQELSGRPFAEQSMELLENAQYRPHHEKYSEISTYLSQMANSVVCGAEPEEALETYSQAVISIVGEEGTQSLAE